MEFITVEELSKTKKEYLLVDIRGERRSIPQRIEGSIIVDVYDDIHFGRLEIAKEKLSALPKDRTIVLICNSGSTTQPASAILELMGYKTKILENGMIGWNAAKI